MVNNQQSYAAAVGQNATQNPTQKSQTFPFTTEQLTKFVANMVIQIVQPQVC